MIRSLGASPALRVVVLASGVLAGGGCSPRGATISGTVVDTEGAPIASARVRLQGTVFATQTDIAGRFRLSFPHGTGARAVAAWKEGHFNAGARLVEGHDQYRIVLGSLPVGDFADRGWTSSRGSGELACERCHPALAGEWEKSAHATAATNPLFLALFEGTDRDGIATGGPGYRRDYPNATGNCATCHVPALARDEPFAADPRHASGVASEGVFCDFCHKVQRATVDDTGGRPGVLSLALLRPPLKKNVFFGPLDDVIAGPDSFSPLYQDSRYCAPCHHGTFWNVRAYSEFEEWAASSYAKKNVHCQDCHMKPQAGPPRRFALKSEGGVLRDPATLSSHVLFGVNDPAFMRAAVALKTEANLVGDAVRVRVSLRNVRAGHHIPTGSPMRNMLLLVEAMDAGKALLPLVSGERAPNWAGQGSPDNGDYAGLPGKGFAKILSDLVQYPADRPRGRSFERVFPAPYWRPTVVAFDTRIPAGATDVSEYNFGLTGARSGLVTIRTRVIYRRTFRSWGKVDRITNGDLQLASSEAQVVWQPVLRQGEGQL